jgi:hypothetical protein
MPDKEETMVDIDTSAPDQEVEITSEDTSTEETENLFRKTLAPRLSMRATRS